jgi:O-antigen/teichoic acid export membrane protein
MYRTALVFSLIEKNLSLIIRFGSSIILARLLTPEDFGIFAIATTFIFFAETIQQVGIPNYILKEDKLDSQKLSSAFILMMSIGVSVAAILFISAPSIAHFYESSDLAYLLQLTAITLVIAPISTIERSLLRRSLKFKKIAVIEVIAISVGTLVSLGFASKSFGVVSLSYGLVIQYFVLAILFRFWRSDNVKLGFHISRVAEIWKFTSPLLVASAIAQFGNTAPQLFIGKIFSDAALGQYARAQSTADLFGSLLVQGLRPAIAPIFSDLKRQGSSLAEPLQKIVNVQCTIGWPFYLFIAYFSLPIITTIYGNQWVIASNLVLWFCIAQSISLITSYYTDILEGLGHSKVLLSIQIKIQAMRLLCLGLSFYISEDLNQFAMWFILSFCTVKFFYMIYVGDRFLHLKHTELLKPCIPALFSLIVFSLPLVAHYVLRIETTLTSFTSILLISFIIWFIVLINVNSLVKTEITTIIKKIRGL